MLAVSYVVLALSPGFHPDQLFGLLQYANMKAGRAWVTDLVTSIDIRQTKGGHTWGGNFASINLKCTEPF